MMMVTETSNSCENCCKSFSSKKNLRRHKINSCKEHGKKTDSPLSQTTSTPAMATVVPKSVEVFPNPVAVPTKKTVVAFECEYCNRLFRSKEALISHLKEHEEELEDDDEEEESEEEEENVQETVSVKSEENQREGNIKSSNFIDYNSHSNITPRKVVEEVKEDHTVRISVTKVDAMKRKASSLQEILQTQQMLRKKLHLLTNLSLSSRFQMPEISKTISVSVKELQCLQEKSRCVDSLQQNLNMLELKLTKVQEFGIKKDELEKSKIVEMRKEIERASKSLASKEIKVNKPKENKENMKRSQKEMFKDDVSLSFNEVYKSVKEKKILNSANNQESNKFQSTKRVPKYIYHELLKKSNNLQEIKLQQSQLMVRIASVNKFVASRKVDIHKMTKENIKSEAVSPVKDDHDALLNLLEPEVIVKEESQEVNLPEEFSSKPEERFLELKSKLQDNLCKRAKLNSKIEEIMQRKFSSDSQEEADKRMKARLEREQTVREVQKRIEEKKEAEKKKELAVKEKDLRQTLEGLRKEMQELSDSLSPTEPNAKKKSRREMRKHLQEKVEPKPEMAMSIESRLENIKDMETERDLLQKKITDMRDSTCSESSVEVKNETASNTPQSPPHDSTVTETPDKNVNGKEYEVYDMSNDNENEVFKSDEDSEHQGMEFAEESSSDKLVDVNLDAEDSGVFKEQIEEIQTSNVTEEYCENSEENMYSNHEDHNVITELDVRDDFSCEEYDPQETDVIDMSDEDQENDYVKDESTYLEDGGTGNISYAEDETVENPNEVEPRECDDDVWSSNENEEDVVCNEKDFSLDTGSGSSFNIDEDTSLSLDICMSDDEIDSDDEEANELLQHYVSDKSAFNKIRSNSSMALTFPFPSTHMDSDSDSLNDVEEVGGDAFMDVEERSLNSPVNSQSLDIDDMTEVQVNFEVEDQEVIDVIETVIDAVFEASSSQTRAIVSQIVADLLESFGQRKEDCYVAFEDDYDGDDEGELMVAEDESDPENQSEDEMM